MARPTETECTTATLVANGCYKNLGNNERAALMVYLKALELEALGGTDYTDPEVLNLAAACYEVLSADAMAVGELVIQAGNADDSGATIPTDAEVPAAIACFKNYTMNQLNAMELFLDCQLGRHENFPQVNL